MCTLIIGTLFAAMLFGIHWIAGTVLSGILLLIIVLPVEGFHETEKEDIELMRLKRGKKGQTYYLEITGKNKVVFAYDNSDKYDLDGGAYEEDFRKGKVKVYESNECEEPVLRTFITRPVRDMFTIAPFSTKKEYVFYVIIY